MYIIFSASCIYIYIYAYMVWWLCNHTKLRIARRSYICVVDLWVKNGVASEIFGHLMQKGSSVAHSPYDIYSMVGRSIASICRRGRIYWLWTSLPYYILYICIYYKWVCSYYEHDHLDTIHGSHAWPSSIWCIQYMAIMTFMDNDCILPCAVLLHIIVAWLG